LRRDFPLKETFPQVPCIIPVYLLYNILHDRTTTDREIVSFSFSFSFFYPELN